MLVIGRREGDSVVIGPDVRVTLVRVGGGTVRLGIEAPADVRIVRSELLEEDEKESA
jgi:carbon storage regulator